MAEGGVTIRQQWHALLVSLKSTVEGLLSTQTTNVWNMYGGLDRICADMAAIINHRLKATQGPQGSILDFWSFVCGLQWINPSMAANIEQFHKLIRGGSPGHRGNARRLGQLWLRQSFLDLNLSAQLQALVANTEHLQYHYEGEAFLCEPSYVQAMFVCLQAVEQNKAALLAEINPVVLRRSLHNRPNSRKANANKRKGFLQMSPALEGEDEETDSSYEAFTQLGDSPEEPLEKDSLHGSCLSVNDPLLNMQISESTSNQVIKKSSSFTIARPAPKESAVVVRSETTGLLDSILNHDDVPETCDSASLDEIKGSNDIQQSSQKTSTPTSKPRGFSHQRSVSDIGIGSHRAPPPDLTRSHLVGDQNCKRWQAAVDEDGPGLLSSSLPNVNEPDGPQYKKDGVFRKPTTGQSLLSFLSSQDFHTCAELDKENAHFTLAEGLISAIEQMKWNQVLRPASRSGDHEEGDSDEEIQQLKQRIRIRRRERMTEKAKDFPSFFEDKRNDSVSSSGRTSPVHTTSNFSSISQVSTDSEDIHDQEIADTDEGSNTNNSSLVALKTSGLSLSMASLYSEVEIQKSNASLEKSEEIEKPSTIPEPKYYNNMLLSAESVAISLLRRFSEKQLPKASELEWLVSEQDAPQQLLPLPDSYPISPDDIDTTRLRGNLEWAPPRPQIIFNIHPPPRRKTVLAKQNYHCAGCGAKVEPGYTKRYRYCEYLGKYFCPCCHSNTLAYIPGHILRRWDFTKYPVSNFSGDLLRRIYKDPLFNIQDINPSLYRRIRPLEAVRECRKQLRHLVAFLSTCRLGQKQQEKLTRLPYHWTDDIHLYSLLELMEIKKSEHGVKLKQLVNECVGHVAKCPLCQVKGFICEVCRNADDIIYPFELNKVQQCPECRSCFHKACYNPKNCTKCARMAARRHQLEVELSSPEPEEAGNHSLSVNNRDPVAVR